MTESALSPTDEQHLLTAVAIARNARAHGNHPFGALLVGPDGSVLAEAENTAVTERDVTGHAETNLARIACRNFEPGFLRRCTLYTSAEPCAMCSGAIYWAQIGRVVYALAEDALREITGDHPENPTMSLPCREVFARGQYEIQVAGPAAVPGTVEVHDGFWT